MITLKTLAKNMNARADNLEQENSRRAVQAALTIIGSLIYDTPVDTSNALSGWQIGLGTPVNSRRKPYFPGKYGTTYKLSTQAALSAARERLKVKLPGQPIYISNLEPYIRLLDAGSSAQNPGAFIALAVRRGRLGLHKKGKGT